MVEALPKIESLTEDDLKLAREAGFDIRPYVGEDPLTRKGYREITDEDKKVSWGDYGRAAASGAAGIGEGAAALTEWATRGRLGGDARKFFGDIAEDQVSRIGPRARRALTSEVFADEGKQSIFDDFASSLGLKTVAALPSTAASIIPAGIAVRALSAASTATRIAAAGAVARGTNAALTGGEVAQQIYATVDKMTDEELKNASDLYAGYRSMMSEKDARARYMPEVAGAAPFVGVVLGGLTPGVETMLAKRLGGEAAMGVLKGFGKGAVTEAGQEFVEGVGGEAVSQSALLEAGLKSKMDWEKVLGQGLEGALVGLGMGGAGGAASGIGGRKPAVANGVTALPDNGVAPDHAAALGAAVPQPAPVQQGLGKAKADEIRARARAASGPPPKGAGTGAAAQPAETPTGNANEPARSDTEYPKEAQPVSEEAAPDTVPPKLKEALRRVTGQVPRASASFVQPMTARIDVPTDVAAALQRVVAPVVEDTGANTQEPRAQLLAQQDELVRGEAPAQMFPRGTDPLPPPPGTERVETPRGAFNIDPTQVSPEQVRRASAARRENEVLGLGSQNKDDVVQRAAQTGEPIVAVQTQTPDGTPVREAMATPSTAPQTAAEMEAASGKPAKVKPVVEVLRRRGRAVGPKGEAAKQVAAPITPEGNVSAPPPAGRVLVARDDKLKAQLDKKAADARRGMRGAERTEWGYNARQAFVREARVAVNQMGEGAPRFYREAIAAEEARAAAQEGNSGRAAAGSPADVAAKKLKVAWDEAQKSPDQRMKVRGATKGGQIAREEQAEQAAAARDGPRRAKKEAVPEVLTKEQIKTAIDLVGEDIREQIENTSSENVRVRLREDEKRMAQFLETTAQEDPDRFREIVAALTKKTSAIGIFNVDENRGGDQLVTSSDIEEQYQEQVDAIADETRASMPVDAAKLKKAAEVAAKMSPYELISIVADIEAMTDEQFRDFLVDATTEEYARALAANAWSLKTAGVGLGHFEQANLKAAVRAMMREPVRAKKATTLGKLLEDLLPEKKSDAAAYTIGFLHRRLINLVGDMKVSIADARSMRKASGAFGRDAAAGVYRPEFNDIVLLDGQMTKGANASYWLVAHEALHGALTNLMARSPNFKRQVESLLAYVKAQVASNPKLREKYGRVDEIYGLANADEFLAETNSNMEFQSLLYDIDISNDQVADMGIRVTLRDKIDNALKAFVAAIRGALNLSPDTMTALEAALRVTDEGLVMREFKGAGARNSAMTPEQRASWRDARNKAELLPERLLSKQKPLEARIRAELRDSGVSPEIAKEIAGIIREEAAKGAKFDALLPLIKELADEFSPKTSKDDAPIVDGKPSTEKEFIAAINGSLEPIKVEAAALEKRLENAPTNAPWALQLRGMFNLAKRFEPYAPAGVNPVRTIHNLLENRGVRQGDYTKRSEPIVVRFFETEKRYAATPEGRKQWEKFGEFLNRVTMANIRPDLPLADNKHLGKDALKGMWSKEQHAELSAQHRALPSDLRELYQEGREHLEGLFDQQGMAALRGVFNAAGFTDDAMIRRFYEDTQTAADVKAIGDLAGIIEDLPEFKKLGGAYFPLTRRGNWVVRGTVDFEKPTDAVHQADAVTFDFKDRKAAIAFAQKQTSRPYIITIHVDPKTNERFFTDAAGKQVPVTAKDIDGETRFRVRVNNEITEFAGSRKAGEVRREELKKAGVQVRDVTERKFDTLEQTNAGLPPRLRALVSALERRSGYKDMSSRQKNELLGALHEISVRMPNAKPRRNIAGASTDVSRNLYDYTTRMAGYLAKAETQPSVDAAAKQLEDLLKQIESGNTKRSAAARAVANEVQRRLQIDARPDENLYVKEGIDRVLAWSAADKLASPAYSIVNATQVGMLTYPVLAAKHGSVRALVAIKRAYKDVSALKNIVKGLTDTGRATAGKRLSTNFIDDIKARLTNADEKRMIDELVAVRAIEAESGFEVSRLIAAREGALGKIDAATAYLETVTRALPTAVEANNRTITALAAYRLARESGLEHKAAVEYAQEIVIDTQFLYTASNAPPVMNKAGVRLVTQFMKYPQAIYQLLGDQLGKAIRNDRPGDRKEVLKVIGYIALTHGVMAGALGLPWEPLKIALAISSAMIGGPSPDDVEEYLRKQAAQAFGKTGGEMLTRGVTRGLPGGLAFDLSSRMGLDNLVSFGQPRSNAEKDIKSFLFDRLAGAPGSYVGDLVKASNALMTGEPLKAAELAIPLKIFADSLKAYRLMDEGKKSPGGRETLTPYSPLEAGIRAFGFTPEREAETSEYRRTVGGNIAQYNQQRTKLLQDYAQNPKNRAKAMIAIEKFNRGKSPELQITDKDRRDAEKRLERTKTQTFGGFPGTPRNRAMVEQSDFYNTGR